LRSNLGFALAGISLIAGSAFAATITIPVAIGAGAPITGTVDLTDNGGDIDVLLNLDHDGDLRGFWFTLTGDHDNVGSLDPVVTGVCEFDPPDDNVCGGGNVMSGAGQLFEYAFALGVAGQGDVGPTTSFTISADQAITTAMFLGNSVGVRVQEIDPPVGGQDSAKLVGVCRTDQDCEGGGPPEEIPEPSTMLMLASGAGLIAFSRRGR